MNRPNLGGLGWVTQHEEDDQNLEMILTAYIEK